MITLRNLDSEDVEDDVPPIGITLEPSEEGRWSAQCLETGLTGLGDTPDEAVAALETLRIAN